MITINNIQYRTLEEQVRKNQQDIKDIKDLNIFINGLGIMVLGILPTPDDIPAMPYEPGDAYLIGEEAPYNLYVYTRGDTPWVDLGPLAVVGPQGEQGPQGEKGDTGVANAWFTNSSFREPMEGDFRLLLDGTVMYFNGEGWENYTNIKGPQGAQGNPGDTGSTGPQGPIGPQGPKGDSGGFIHIVGIVANEDLLPEPALLNDLTAAFLVGEGQYPDDPPHAFVQVGNSVETAIWIDIGALNIATYVTVGGNYVGTWDADTKVTVLDPGDVAGVNVAKVYGYKWNAVENTYEPQLVDVNNNSFVGETIIGRTYDGGAYVNCNARLAGSNYMVVNKDYADNHYVPKSTTPWKVYGVGGDGASGAFWSIVSNSTDPGSVPQRTSYGELACATTDSSSDNMAVNKGYAAIRYNAYGHNVQMTIDGTNCRVSFICKTGGKILNFNTFNSFRFVLEGSNVYVQGGELLGVLTKVDPVGHKITLSKFDGSYIEYDENVHAFITDDTVVNPL